jgi:hypothetical protein
MTHDAMKKKRRKRKKANSEPSKQQGAKKKRTRLHAVLMPLTQCVTMRKETGGPG